MSLRSKPNPDTTPEWVISPGLTPYPEALAAMEAHVAAMQLGNAGERIWLLEHPPLYTAGTSAKGADLLNPAFPVFEAGRGGQYTYHGPGQRIAYVMLDLNTRERDLRAYVHGLEEWLILALARLDVTALRRDGRVGLWVERGDGRDDKIAAIGVRVRRWVTLHGISLNVSPDLSHYAGIVPCGIKEHGVTSLKQLGKSSDMTVVDVALKAAWSEVF
jgi:lipoyl(octanoyl) transferase